MSQFKNGDSFGFVLRFGFKVDAPAYAVSAQIRDGAMRLIDMPVIRALENSHSYLLAPSQVLDPGRYQFDVVVSSGGAVTHSETYKFTVLTAVTTASGAVLDAAVIDIESPEVGQVVVQPVGARLGVDALCQTLRIEPIIFAESVRVEAVKGSDGKGWTAGNYDPETGSVSFESDDGLEFETGDLRGPAGESPNLSVGTVETLQAGSSATAEITGDFPNLSINFKLPAGIDGQSGESINLSVGMVETLPAGASATAELVGTGANLVLNLGLPAGADGPSNGGSGDLIADPNVQMAILDADFFIDSTSNPAVTPQQAILPGFQFTVEAGETYEVELILFLQWNETTSVTKYLSYKFIDATDRKSSTFNSRNVGLCHMQYHDDGVLESVSTRYLTPIDSSVNLGFNFADRYDRQELKVIATASVAHTVSFASPVMNGNSVRTYFKGSRMTKRRLS